MLLDWLTNIFKPASAPADTSNVSQGKNTATGQQEENYFVAEMQSNEFTSATTETNEEYLNAIHQAQENQIEEVEKTLDDVQKMREDEEREYRFKLSPTDSKESPSTQYVGNNADGHQVILMTSNSEQINDALFHEIRHGGQIARSELLLDAEGRWLNYGVRKEIDAYKAQWGRYRRLILPINDGSHVLPEAKSINYYGINKAMVHSITENLLSNDYVYPPKDYNKQLWRQN